MNICMALDVNPVTGRIAVAGTDAINEVRFEPNLNGIFVRVKLALVDPLDLGKTVQDLNPHLDYSVSTLPPGEREKSIGDPRAIAWTADGSRAYVAGMGSRNLVMIDAQGQRMSSKPVEVGEGPCGLALDDTRQRLYVYNRFSSSLSVLDTMANAVIDAVPLFDPTPIGIAAGRRHLYDTRRTSGLGQASCASCHVDARMDRLAWDLGNPAGDLSNPIVNHQGTLVTNVYHPLKGVMVTQTLQDIIGHEPFHWRGDRPSLEAFNATFTNLQGAATSLTTIEMTELRDFLASIRLPPNPYRQFDNSLSTNMPLPGHFALGSGSLPAGAALPNGNAAAGLSLFNQPDNFCASCHSLPTGLGVDLALQGGVLKPIPLGTNGEHHLPVAFRLEGSLRSKIAQFRNLADKLGMDGTRTESRAGFGFGHDGSVDSLIRFLNGVRIIADQDVADLIALLLSVSGSDTGADLAETAPAAAVGRQLTLSAAGRPPLLDAMLALARSPASRVELIVKGMKDGLHRGWFYDRARDLFQSDRQQESLSPDALLALAGLGTELTFTVVPLGCGIRLGIDRDFDGLFDRDEIDTGTNPADSQLRPRVVAPLAAGGTGPNSGVAAGTDLRLEVELPPLPAPLSGITWWKDGQPLAGETSSTVNLTNVSFSGSGEYSVVVTTPFQTWTSSPVRVTVVPLLVTVTPPFQGVRLGSNAVFTANVGGVGPFDYQWQLSGQDLADARAASLTVSNAQLAGEGAYRVRVVNSYGAVVSDPVGLSVLINPALLIPPLNQSVVAGENATFSFMISGHPPPFGYLLRKSSVVLTNYTSEETAGFLTLANVQSSNAGTYRIVITNAANPSPGLSLDPVTLTVLADNDHDGLPDDWEALHGLDSTDPDDAQLDSDFDGQTNWQEYAAGTDPQDPRSFLKFDRIFFAEDKMAAIVQFTAFSNKTYTVQSANLPSALTWSRVVDIVALSSNRVVSITNLINETQTRFYRLITPRVWGEVGESR
jgi:YVTN family beta-propeller protein